MTHHAFQTHDWLFAREPEVPGPRSMWRARTLTGWRLQFAGRNQCSIRQVRDGRSHMLDSATDVPDWSALAEFRNDQTIEKELAVKRCLVVGARPLEQQPQPHRHRHQLGASPAVVTQPPEEGASAGISQALCSRKLLRD